MEKDKYFRDGKDLLSLPTKAEDGRPTLRQLFDAYAAFEENGWKKVLITWQEITLADGYTFQVPICAYLSKPEEAISGVLIGCIHGTEPAGATAIAESVPELLTTGREKSLMVIPIANAYGYFNNQRYQEQSESVGDMEWLLGRMKNASCKEASDIGRFLQNLDGRLKNCLVLDLHEDLATEWNPDDADDDDHDGEDALLTYVYISGTLDREEILKNSFTMQLLALLHGTKQPLLRKGTRFGEPVNENGAVLYAQDGSVDEWLAIYAAVVFTLETFIHTPIHPPLSERVKVHKEAIKILCSNL